MAVPVPLRGSRRESAVAQLWSLDLVPRMRAFIILLLSCAWAAAADTGVQATSTVNTNAETGAVYTTETFTRGGQTILVRVTKTVDGTVAVRQQKFYHDGEQLAVFMYWAQTKSESFTTTESSSCSVGLDFSATRDIERLIISRKKGSVLDGFSFTNGIFYPVSDSDLQPYDVK
jgi:hypothetical protein